MARREVRPARLERDRFRLGCPVLRVRELDQSHSVAFTADLEREGLSIYLILNAYWESLEFEPPPASDGGSWRRWIDTARESPEDIVPWQTAPLLSGHSYRAEARSVVVLYKEIGREKGPHRGRQPEI